MVTGVTTSTTGTSAADAAMKASTGMNKDDFLKLFVTQLQNQDPLNPQDSTQFLSQLAQMTQVEQAYNTNSNLTSMLNQGVYNATMSSVSLIGKQVEAPGSQVGLQSGSSAAINFNLGSPASQVTVKVLDSNGATVKTLTGGAASAGAGSIAWDGTNDAGTQQASGVYSFSVSATDASGTAVTSTGIIKGKVDGVDMSGTIPILSIGNVKLSLTDITSVSGGA
jgi:flagellar basal-body rod modification protein FlgD